MISLAVLSSLLKASSVCVIIIIISLKKSLAGRISTSIFLGLTHPIPYHFLGWVAPHFLGRDG